MGIVGGLEPRGLEGGSPCGNPRSSWKLNVGVPSSNHIHYLGSPWWHLVCSLAWDQSLSQNCHLRVRCSWSVLC